MDFENTKKPTHVATVMNRDSCHPEQIKKAVFTYVINRTDNTHSETEEEEINGCYKENSKTIIE
jgi:hypothetical protein